ncbi:hypothetical protein PIB30_048193 [Stylosanthes scabra]|uniref:BED-type domain-containing protein n=1 Tax=Stylosanthes scabra TaxID=79078 RepID=A0ABU6YFQ5_9FABA|nr:hypothetical protein [Stylosanthes scabra]
MRVGSPCGILLSYILWFRNFYRTENPVVWDSHPYYSHVFQIQMYGWQFPPPPRVSTDFIRDGRFRGDPLSPRGDGDGSPSVNGCGGGNEMVKSQLAANATLPAAGPSQPAAQSGTECSTQQSPDDVNDHGTKRKLTSEVWNHFKRQKIDNKWKAICNSCKAKLRGDPKQGTSHLRDH